MVPQNVPIWWQKWSNWAQPSLVPRLAEASVWHSTSRKRHSCPQIRSWQGWHLSNSRVSGDNTMLRSYRCAAGRDQAWTDVCSLEPHATSCCAVRADHLKFFPRTAYEVAPHRQLPIDTRKRHVAPWHLVLHRNETVPVILVFCHNTIVIVNFSQGADDCDQVAFCPHQAQT